MTKTEIKEYKLQSVYYLQKITNSVIKWTSIINAQVSEKRIDKSLF